MKTQKISLAGLATMCAFSMCAVSVVPQPAEAKMVKSDGWYEMVSPRVSSGNKTVKKIKLTKKKLTVKGALFRNGKSIWNPYKKMKGKSFTFRMASKVWIGEYEEDNPPFKKYTGSRRTQAIRQWNKNRFLAISFQIKKGKVIKLVSHA